MKSTSLIVGEDGHIRVLAIDPGVQTGFVLLREDGLVEATGTLSIEDLPSSVLTKYASRSDINVVVEKSPMPRLGKLGDQLRLCHAFVQQHFPEATLIPPGVWKQMTPVRKIDFGKVSTTRHQKDALHLALYHLWHESGILHEVHCL